MGLSAAELRILDRPEDEGAWRSYADELRRSGDPRAPLIALDGPGGSEVPPPDQIPPQPLLGKLLPLPHYNPDAVEAGFWLTWRHGFVLSLVLDISPTCAKWPPLPKQLKTLLDSPAARLLRSIDVRRIEAGTTDADYLKAILSAPRPALRRLSLPLEEANSLSLEALPALEELTLRGTSRLHALSSTHLRQLTIDSHDLTVSAMKGLASSTLPKLKSLRISMGVSETIPVKQRADALSFQAVIDRFPQLEQLAVHQVPFGDALAAHLATAPVRLALEELDLRRAQLTARGVESLGGAKFPRLSRLLLDGPMAMVATQRRGALATAVVSPVPSASAVAAQALAIATELSALAEDRNARADEDAADRAARIRRWGHLHLSDAFSGVAEHASRDGLEMLLWALNGSEVAEVLSAFPMTRFPMTRSIDGLLHSARLRELAELAAKRAAVEEQLWNTWREYGDVRELREQLRALRWIDGEAPGWKDVPTHLARHPLPKPGAIDPGVRRRLDQAWRQLRGRFRQKPPGGVSEDAVDAVERELGFRFPPDLRASFLAYGAGTYGPMGLLSLEAAVETWRRFDAFTDWTEKPKHTAADDPSRLLVKPGKWRRAWFPLCSVEELEDLYCADLDPANGGAIGQIFYWAHEYPGPECVHAPSFVEWLEWAATSDQFDPSR